MIKLYAISRLIPLLFYLFIFQSFYAQTAEQEAQQMLDLVNGIRTDRGLSPLVLNTKLNKAAYDHSDDMARNNYFSHTGQNGSTFSQRILNAGYEGSPRGENIAAGNSGVTATFNQWLNSSGHLNNMLNANANEMGIGHAFDSSATYRHYWTQVFGKGDNVLSNDEVAVAKNIKIYPNPVQNVLYIRLKENPAEKLDVKLISATGQTLHRRVNGQLTKNLSIDMSDLSPGIYFLTFKNSTRKIVKY